MVRLMMMFGGHVFLLFRHPKGGLPSRFVEHWLYMAKALSNMRLSDEALAIIASEAVRLGIPKTAVVEMALREWAKKVARLKK